MAERTRLSIAKSDIFALMQGHGADVFTRADLGRILNENRAQWRLAIRTTTDEFIAFLKEKGKLKSYELKPTEYTQIITRYSWEQSSPSRLALSIRKGSYLTHGTAVWLHGLNDLIPKVIYVNSEQSVKPKPKGSLSQRSIDMAFSRKQRQSNLIYEFDDNRVVMISGKNTSNLGVTTTKGLNNEVLEFTDLERTLIDIVVRPGYSGGVTQIAEAYRRALSRVSTNRVIAYLTKLDYVYPYHQAIGYLMQLAGYPESKYGLMKDKPIEFDFYLTHGIASPNYNKEWKLFVPQGF